MNINDMKPGDVLLYSSRSMIGKLISKLDGTDVTHAGVYLGNRQVGEALMVGNSGINSNPVNVSFSGSDWIEVRRLIDPELDASPIIEVANLYIDEGSRYAYAEIVLLAVILITRKLEIEDSRLARIAWIVFRKVNNWIENTFDQGREPMICSEFAFRCYDQADPAEDDPYTLEILSQSGHLPFRGFSRQRRGEKVFGDQPETQLPTIAPDSLLASSLQKSMIFEMVIEGEQLTEHEVPDIVLNGLIEEYLNEQDHTRKMVYEVPNVEGIPAPTREVLQQIAARLAFKLASPTRSIFKAAPYTSASAGDRVTAVFADFVTPGDLLKSPSLEGVGRIHL